MNANLTFRELKAALDKIPEERLNDHVSILRDDFGEFFELKEVHVSAPGNDADGVLEDGHYFLVDSSNME